MAKEKVLITVKTYPTLSRKYGELVCTAGFREDGSWVRIYPVPFRTTLDFYHQYKKYQWIELELERHTSDFRPETYRPKNIDDIKLLNVVGPEKNWQKRKELIFKKSPVFENLKELINLAKSENLSLAIFKPKKLKNLIIERTDPDWNPEVLREVVNKSKQHSIFEGSAQLFKTMPKIPFKFRYHFEDSKGIESRPMIEDWEAGQLYLNCLKKYSPEVAAKKVREKYLDEFTSKKDVFLFLGTTLKNHHVSLNPFLIIGVFYPPIEREPLLI